jgi:hypothetical protein
MAERAGGYANEGWRQTTASLAESTAIRATGCGAFLHTMRDATFPLHCKSPTNTHIPVKVDS